MPLRERTLNLQSVQQRPNQTGGWNMQKKIFRIGLLTLSLAVVCLTASAQRRIDGGERRELRADRHEVRADTREIRSDRRDFHGDRQERSSDIRELKQDRREGSLPAELRAD